MAFLDSYRPLRTAAGAIAAPSRSAASAQQLRPVFMRTGAVAQASGSACMECGRTKVLVAVHGPRHSTRGAAVESAERGRVWCDFKFAPFAQTQRRRRGQDPDERAFSALVAEALEVSVLVHRFPKNTVEIHVLVLEDDGGVVSTALTCASLALVDAGIEVYDLVAACSASFIGSRLVLDPDAAAESNLFASIPTSSSGSHNDDALAAAESAPAKCADIAGGMLLACMPSIGQVTHVSQAGALSKDAMAEAVTLCTDACAKLHALMREHLLRIAARRAAQQSPSSSTAMDADAASAAPSSAAAAAISSSA